MKSNATYKKLVMRIALVIVLIVAMAVTTYAYIAASLTVANNTFTTGVVDINIYYCNPETGEYTDTNIFGENVDQELMEPGATFTTSFKLENKSSDLHGVYFKLYFEQVSGELADIIEATITDANGNVLLQGKVGDLNEANVESYMLPYNENRIYTVSFHYPELEGNDGMDKELTFALTAKAVQSKNQDANNVQFD